MYMLALNVESVKFFEIKVTSKSTDFDTLKVIFESKKKNLILLSRKSNCSP